MAEERGFDLREKFRAVGKALRAGFEELDAGGKHGGEKGLRREQVLCDLLARHLPPRYGVSRGEIVDARGQVSRQLDVVIYDALHAPLLQDARASGVFPAECVYAAIELKARVDGSDLLDLAERANSVKALERSAIVATHGGHRIYHGPRQNPPIFYAVFALQASSAREALVPELARLEREFVPERWLDCICVLDRALIYHFLCREDPLGNPEWVPTILQDGARVGYYDSGEDTLLLFLLFLLYQLNSRELFPPDLLAYVRGVKFPGPRIYRPGPEAKM